MLHDTVGEQFSSEQSENACLHDEGSNTVPEESPEQAGFIGSYNAPSSSEAAALQQVCCCRAPPPLLQVQ